MATKTKNRPTPARGSSPRYLALVREVPLLPIKSEAELDRAIAMTHKLAPRQDLTPDEDGYLRVLAGLIGAYEDERHAIEVHSTPAEKLRRLMESAGTTAYQLAKETGISNSTLSEILSGKVGISPRVRKALAERFKMKESAFI